MTDLQRKKRVDYCKKQIGKIEEQINDDETPDYERCVFGDEAKMNSFAIYRRTVWVCRGDGETAKDIDPSFFQEVAHNQHDGVSIMVFAIISLKGPLHIRQVHGKLNSPGYIEIIDECLDKVPELGTGELLW